MSSLRDWLQGKGLAMLQEASAQEIVLAPGIVVSEDTCGGRHPRIAGHRVSTAICYDFWRAEIPRERLTGATFTVTEHEWERAIAFEAGRQWERDERKRRKRKKLARRWKAGHEAAEALHHDAPAGTVSADG